MKLTFLGATGTVTGSKYLLETGSKRILIDCGLFQGVKPLRLKNWEPLPFDPGSIDAVVLTHSHIDHSGYIPVLVRDGYRGVIVSTRGTFELCEILLPDSGYLQEEEARFANRHGFSKHHPALPLYTEEDARRSLGSFLPVSTQHDVEIADGIMLRFRPAGHIIGAATAEIRANDLTVLFSGDLGRSQDILMKPPTPVASADYLILESTYGDRLHSRSDPQEALAAVINRTVERKGAIIVPSFAVGRAQSLLLLVQRLKRSKSIPDIPVYLNSPMAIDATDIFRRHVGEHRLSDEECRELYRDVHLVRTTDESKALNRRSGPMIIISASGMATGGRVLHHIAAFAPDPRNTILFTGYQGVGTRGETITSGATEVKIHGSYVPIRAEVAMLDSLSAHADYGEILQWLRNFTSPPKEVFLTHGEPAASDALRRRIVEELGWSCTLPEYQQEVTLQARGTESPVAPAA
jgi:metallo-beta-lactamase family protein